MFDLRGRDLSVVFSDGSIAHVRGSQGRGAGHETGGGPTSDAQEAGAAPASVLSKVRMSNENRYQQRSGSNRRALFPL
jgi:hypothetical protein